MEHTTININPGKKTDKGFCYIEDENIQISFQRVDSNKSIIEIFTQCFKNKIPLEINIKLENDKTNQQLKVIKYYKKLINFFYYLK